jgi:outer membrane protein OmpA-like peptidoglycan-associated protein
MRTIAWATAAAASLLAICTASPVLAGGDAGAAEGNVASPPPAACSAGPYIVFFDRDKAGITPEAATILDSAIAAYAHCGKAPISLAGHTDRSGGDKYNVRLSTRRTDSVRAYLTSHGIPGGAITSRAFGESMPRVPTADGAREAQNRRVEITYGAGGGS